MGQASAGTVSGAPGRTREFKAELNELRTRMRHLGLGHEEIAAEIGRRHASRPREAYRLAWGWTMDEAAARFNEHAARVGTDPAGRASMTGPHLCEYEKWPASTRRPSVYVLYMLAAIYRARVPDLLDLADHEGLPQPDGLVLLRPPGADAVIAGGEPGPPGSPGAQPALAWAQAGGGVCLTLPCVPGRLVIEVSGLPGIPGLPPAGSDHPEAAAGRLALVRDHPPARMT